MGCYVIFMGVSRVGHILFFFWSAHLKIDRFRQYDCSNVSECGNNGDLTGRWKLKVVSWRSLGGPQVHLHIALRWETEKNEVKWYICRQKCNFYSN